MEEKLLDHFISRVRANIYDEPKHISERAAVYDAIHGLKMWVKQQIKDLQDAQAHQQSKERRRQQRLEESEEAFENPYHSGPENGQEAPEVQEIREIACTLAQKAFTNYPYRYLGSTEVRGKLPCGTGYLVSIELE